ncbi:hypothetical protein CMO89_04165 [Candidatus Woesearchaeota archaeon]|nr:hypothetical protein [Candidatus Woesearchaeota archaeon]|tara:strand:- start:2623 stop:6084 length:3462 start_codon:yes stop_codon:yes gene_type:complete
MAEEDKETEEDENIDIDFSKIKKFFKNLFKEDKEEEKKELKKEIKEVDKEIKEDIKEKKGDIKELKEEENEIKEIKEDIKKEPSEKELEKAKEDIKEIKEEVEKEEEDEINIDFSKIKNWFKKAFSEDKDKKDIKEEKKTDEEEEVSFDIKRAKSFYAQYKHYIIPILFILIAGIFSVYLRMMPDSLPITDDWARNSVYSGVKSQIKGQIDQQYPNLPDANKNGLVEVEFNKLLKAERSAIEQQVKGTSQFFKSNLKNEKGTTYLLAIDPYYWYRYSRNVIEKGTTADTTKDGIPWDDHMLAPLGRPADSNFHIYFEVFLYKVFSAFNKDLDLMKVAFFIPVIISTLSVIPAFFIARRIGGNLGGLIAAIMVAIHPALLGRTAGGFADTDAYNVFFPLVITWLALEAFESKNLRSKIILASLSGFFVGLFSFSWMGWWYIFDFILIALLFYITYFIIVHREHLKKGISYFIFNTPVKNTLILLVTFLSVSCVSVTLFTDFWTFRTAPTQPFNFAQIKVVGVTKIWPNVITTVAEQNEASLNNVINQIGIGKRLFFLISLIGIILLLVRKQSKRPSDLWFISLASLWHFIILAFKPQDLHTFIVLISLPIIAKILIALKEKDTKADIKLAIILIIWFIATIYASTKGIRFLLLFVPAFSLAFGIALGIIYEYCSSLISKSLNIHQTITKAALLLLIFFLFLLSPINAAKSTARSEIPSMNDAWYSSLDKIRLESEPDAIVNSWWDFGHWFKAITDRAVTFDGTTQDMPQAHWIGNTLLTSSEETSVGILRMLDCGATNAFDELDKVINDGAKSVDILYEIIVEKETKAKDTLTNNYSLTEEQAAKVLENTHCDPPENYYITSEDMVGKSGVWAHFGSWDFDRATIYNTLIKKDYKKDKEKSVQFLIERFNYTREKAENIYYDVNSLSSNRAVNDWIAPWPSYMSGSSSCPRLNNETLSCSFGQGNVIINLTNYDAFIPTPTGTKYPNSIVYPSEDGIHEKRFYNNTLGFSMALIPDKNGNYQNVVSSQEIASSMFNILFYMEGHGLRYFKKFSDQSSVFGNRIIVWKVDWEGSEMNKLDYFKAKEAVNQTTDQTDINITEEDTDFLIKNISGNDSEAAETINETDVTSNASEQAEDNQTTAETEKLSPPRVSIE